MAKISKSIDESKVHKSLICLDLNKEDKFKEEEEDDNDDKTFERFVIINEETVIKRELNENEYRLVSDTIIYPFLMKARLRNEAATLKFIAANTTIPVPDCRLYMKDGLLHLETIRIKNGIPLEEIDPQLRQAANKIVEDQMILNILPQLHSFRRNIIGSIDMNLPVIPTRGVFEFDIRSWPQISSNTNQFVLCHNDLGPQNIFVDPITFKIVGIIDWEFAGYFPAYFESPLWQVVDCDDRFKIYSKAISHQLAFFGLTAEDLKDCLGTQFDELTYLPYVFDFCTPLHFIKE